MILFDRVLKFYKIQRFRKIVLNYVSFCFEPGASYGVMGVNGAGKSTMMKLIAGAELPNSGRIRRTVRVSWPLGFTGGLHPSMTGRENAQFVARAYGENVREIVDFVEDFAEIGPYLDAPVKTYSSGMIARVAFGLSMAISFDCYLIDEVLGVGDANFQAKCRWQFARRKEYSDVIMISHDTAALREYCDRGAVLCDGQVHLFDHIDDAIDLYKRINM